MGCAPEASSVSGSVAIGSSLKNRGDWVDTGGAGEHDGRCDDDQDAGLSGGHGAADIATVHELTFA